ncbi:PREDICTED: peptidoglycan-recognition protein SB1-like [Papilio polytes]|uniref:peptidoglycan-recognition protein SB1-like n=1 Tax=Papilio polytes TaxID=76194 RepID=UPI0006761D00|nr:PREDICTED: peptidoglycan-recognition protein SB1-like [Papilio polytes]
MQPLISPVDHESRTNSYRAEEENRGTEATPLLQRFPRYQRDDNYYRTRAVVSFLLLILLFGIAIGTYLLIIQSRSENVLPPIEEPERYVSRLQWDKNGEIELADVEQMKKNTVIIVQTDTEECDSTKTCSRLLNLMQKNGARLQYNFLVSPDGRTFEALGWKRSSFMFPEYSENGFVLAFIGNYTSDAPSAAQMMQAKIFLENSISQQHLDLDFDIIGKKTKDLPKYLFLELSKLPQWNKNLSDMN